MTNRITPDLDVHLQVEAEHVENGVRVIDKARIVGVSVVGRPPSPGRELSVNVIASGALATACEYGIEPDVGLETGLAP